MTTQEQYVECAKLLDWTRHIFDDGRVEVEPHFNSPCGKFRYGSSMLPNFDSLDVIHELEKVLTELERREYFFHLFKTQRLDDGELWKAVHTTASQRREAILRTVGKWKD